MSSMVAVSLYVAIPPPSEEEEEEEVGLVLTAWSPYTAHGWHQSSKKAPTHE